MIKPNAKHKSLLVKEDLHSKLEETRKKLGFRTYSEVLNYFIEKYRVEEDTI
jgi:hypothetical protein